MPLYIFTCTAFKTLRSVSSTQTLIDPILFDNDHTFPSLFTADTSITPKQILKDHPIMMISSHLLRLPAPALVRGYASHLVTPASLSGLRHLAYTTSAPSDTQSAAETESNQRETTNETPKSDKEEYESAKSRAWYLNGSTKKSSDLAASASRQPIFTPYNPNTTTDAPEVALPIPELPSNLPPMAKPLHSFLINNPLFTPHTIRFITTTETPATNSSVDPTIYGSSILGGRRRKGLRATIKGTDDESGIRVEGREFGAYWDWICLVEVKASGKGAVRRGEKAIREWVSVHNC